MRNACSSKAAVNVLNMSSSTQGISSENPKASEKIKRPLNAFILWSKKRRRVIANENPQMHNFDISRKLGLEWQKLPEDEKTLYFEEAKKLKEEHKQQYPDYKYQPRKRDKANKRGKMLHGSPFHFDFLAPEGAYMRASRIPLPPDPRPAYAPEGIYPQHEVAGLCDEYASIPHLRMHSPDSSKPGLMSSYSGFRQPCESLISYRGIEPSYVQLRPGMDLAPYNRHGWYTASAGRYGPSMACYGHVVPTYIPRPDLHS